MGIPNIPPSISIRIKVMIKSVVRKPKRNVVYENKKSMKNVKSVTKKKVNGWKQKKNVKYEKKKSDENEKKDTKKKGAGKNLLIGISGTCLQGSILARNVCLKYELKV